MKIEEIKEILRLGEGPNIEFKTSCPNAEVIGPVVGGLLNSSAGGFIVCGIDESGEIIGVDDAEVSVKTLERILENDLSPGTLVEIHVQNINDKDLIVIEVPAGRDPPYAFQNIIYKRTGVETLKADIETIRDLVYRRQVEPERWERRFSLADPDRDLDQKEIETAINSISEMERLQFDDHILPTISFLEKLSVFKYGRLTNGGDVLFTTNPAIRNPQIRVRAARFTADKTDDKYQDLKLFEGPLVPLLEEVFGFIQRNTPTSSDFTTDDLKRKDTSLYPPKAIKEGLVNAFAHRDYSNSSGGVIINIYPNRLEIENSGKFPPGVTPETLSIGHVSILRNPDIAHVLYLRGFMEKIGRGSVLIQKSCIDRGLPVPRWYQTEQGVRLTFFAVPGPQEVTQGINLGIKRMLNVLDGDMSRRELQDLLNLKDEGHFRKTYLKPAIQQNLISQTIPEKPYSNKQKYRLTKKGQSLRDQK
jgi:ATP-dependent DNA helicase RecG